MDPTDSRQIRSQQHCEKLRSNPWFLKILTKKSMLNVFLSILFEFAISSVWIGQIALFLATSSLTNLKTTCEPVYTFEEGLFVVILLVGCFKMSRGFTRYTDTEVCGYIRKLYKDICEHNIHLVLVIACTLLTFASVLISAKFQNIYTVFLFGGVLPGCLCGIAAARYRYLSGTVFILSDYCEYLFPVEYMMQSVSFIVWNLVMPLVVKNRSILEVRMLLDLMISCLCLLSTTLILTTGPDCCNESSRNVLKNGKLIAVFDGFIGWLPENERETSSVHHQDTERETSPREQNVPSQSSTETLTSDIEANRVNVLRTAEGEAIQLQQMDNGTYAEEVAIPSIDSPTGSVGALTVSSGNYSLSQQATSENSAEEVSSFHVLANQQSSPNMPPNDNNNQIINEPNHTSDVDTNNDIQPEPNIAKRVEFVPYSTYPFNVYRARFSELSKGSSLSCYLALHVFPFISALIMTMSLLFFIAVPYKYAIVQGKSAEEAANELVLLGTTWFLSLLFHYTTDCTSHIIKYPFAFWSGGVLMITAHALRIFSYPTTVILPLYGAGFGLYVYSEKIFQYKHFEDSNEYIQLGNCIEVGTGILMIIMGLAIYELQMENYLMESYVPPTIMAVALIPWYSYFARIDFFRPLMRKES